MYSSAIRTLTLISDVEMTWMLMPLSASVLNMRWATPAWLRMPTPITDTLTTLLSASAARDMLAAGQAADLIVGNNVLAHVPDLHDFIEGIKLLLKPAGVLTLEFPHLLRLVEENQFDTIYHEHFSYFSFLTARRALERHGLAVFDVEELPTHGGSLRLLRGPRGPRQRRGRPARPGCATLEVREMEAGLSRAHRPPRLPASKVEATKRDLLTFLIRAKQEGKKVVGYGAPAKGNTLLNYCGVREDFIEFTVDRSPHKQGRFLPGHPHPHPGARGAPSRPGPTTS